MTKNKKPPIPETKPGIVFGSNESLTLYYFHSGNPDNRLAQYINKNGHFDPPSDITGRRGQHNYFAFSEQARSQRCVYLIRIFRRMWLGPARDEHGKIDKEHPDYVKRWNTIPFTGISLDDISPPYFYKISEIKTKPSKQTNNNKEDGDDDDDHDQSYPTNNTSTAPNNISDQDEHWSTYYSRCNQTTADLDDPSHPLYDSTAAQRDYKSAGCTGYMGADDQRKIDSIEDPTLKTQFESLLIELRSIQNRWASSPRHYTNSPFLKGRYEAHENDPYFMLFRAIRYSIYRAMDNGHDGHLHQSWLEIQRLSSYITRVLSTGALNDVQFTHAQRKNSKETTTLSTSIKAFNQLIIGDKYKRKIELTIENTFTNNEHTEAAAAAAASPAAARGPLLSILREKANASIVHSCLTDVTDISYKGAYISFLKKLVCDCVSEQAILNTNNKQPFIERRKPPQQDNQELPSELRISSNPGTPRTHRELASSNSLKSMFEIRGNMLEQHALFYNRLFELYQYMSGKPIFDDRIRSNDKLDVVNPTRLAIEISELAKDFCISTSVHGRTIFSMILEAINLERKISFYRRYFNNLHENKTHFGAYGLYILRNKIEQMGLELKATLAEYKKLKARFKIAYNRANSFDEQDNLPTILKDFFTSEDGDIPLLGKQAEKNRDLLEERIQNFVWVLELPNPSFLKVAKKLKIKLTNLFAGFCPAANVQRIQLASKTIDGDDTKKTIKLHDDRIMRDLGTENLESILKNTDSPTEMHNKVKGLWTLLDQATPKNSQEELSNEQLSKILDEENNILLSEESLMLLPSNKKQTDLVLNSAPPLHTLKPELENHLEKSDAISSIHRLKEDASALCQLVYNLNLKIENIEHIRRTATAQLLVTAINDITRSFNTFCKDAGAIADTDKKIIRSILKTIYSAQIAILSSLYLAKNCAAGLVNFFNYNEKNTDQFETSLTHFINDGEFNNLHIKNFILDKLNSFKVDSLSDAIVADGLVKAINSVVKSSSKKPVDNPCKNGIESITKKITDFLKRPNQQFSRADFTNLFLSDIKYSFNPSDYLQTENLLNYFFAHLRRTADDYISQLALNDDEDFQQATKIRHKIRDHYIDHLAANYNTLIERQIRSLVKYLTSENHYDGDDQQTYSERYKDLLIKINRGEQLQPPKGINLNEYHAPMLCYYSSRISKEELKNQHIRNTAKIIVTQVQQLIINPSADMNLKALKQDAKQIRDKLKETSKIYAFRHRFKAELSHYWESVEISAATDSQTVGGLMMLAQEHPSKTSYQSLISTNKDLEKHISENIGTLDINAASITKSILFLNAKLSLIRQYISGEKISINNQGIADISNCPVNYDLAQQLFEQVQNYLSNLTNALSSNDEHAEFDGLTKQNPLCKDDGVFYQLIDKFRELANNIQSNIDNDAAAAARPGPSP